eukprot:GHVQ01017676.1.p1 GENE.GHVQ01017676.1~~GHVQ01017676.1.p1  ORF type:complete len:732 (+),score=104.81 GHVQ01017676.1:582-2777(+)
MASLPDTSTSLLSSSLSIHNSGTQESTKQSHNSSQQLNASCLSQLHMLYAAVSSLSYPWVEESRQTTEMVGPSIREEHLTTDGYDTSDDDDDAEDVGAPQEPSFSASAHPYYPHHTRHTTCMNTITPYCSCLYNYYVCICSIHTSSHYVASTISRAVSLLAYCSMPFLIISMLILHPSSPSSMSQPLYSKHNPTVSSPLPYPMSSSISTTCTTILPNSVPCTTILPNSVPCTTVLPDSVPCTTAHTTTPSSLPSPIFAAAGIIPVESSDPKHPSILGHIRAEIKQRVLLLVSDESVKAHTHTKFILMLKNKGFDLDVRLFNDVSARLSEYGRFKYDFLVIVDTVPVGSTSEHANELASMDLQHLLDFVDGGGSVFLITGPNAGGTVRKFANEVGLDFDKPSSYVVDHASEHSALSDRHSIIATTDVISGTPIVERNITDKILYEGIGHLLNPSNTLTVPILRAPPTAYCSSSSTTSGQEILLVSAMQARNSARVTVSGSAELFSDRFFILSEGNRQLADSLVDWTFHRSGVLRWSNVKHHKEGEEVTPHMYRVKDVIVFSIDIHLLKDGKWIPFKANDVQLEFTMLDPHIRAFLNPPMIEGSPTYTLKFMAPDRYGVFKFVVNYNRPGYTQIHMESLAPLRNFKHNDYPRFLVCAYPYYGSVIASLIGLFLFSLLFLYNKENCTKATQSTTASTAPGGSAGEETVCKRGSTDSVGDVGGEGVRQRQRKGGA